MARPAIEALAEQQKTIQAQAGWIGQLSRTAVAQQQIIDRQGEQIARLAQGFQALVEHAGAEALGKVTAAMTRRADVQNPAQPVPEPPSEPSPHGTQETKTPEAFADVNAPGLVPGSTQDVAADATSTVYTPGLDIPAPPVKQLVDVTRPVDGTQGPLPLGDVKTYTDVRVGDPMNPQTAFPVRGDFANAQRTSALQQAGDSTIVGQDGSARTMAALRLAKLRIEARTAESTDEFAETARIEKDAAMTTEVIEREITTLAGVKTAALRTAANRNAGLVPRMAGAGQRSVPSMQGAPISTTASAATPASVETDVDDSIFL